jgi:hypothetical protein
MLRAAIALLVWLVPSIAQAEKRLALLIGNESYSAGNPAETQIVCSHLGA